MTRSTEPLTLSSEVFTRGVDEIIGKEDLAESLRGNKKLRIKLGIDATAPVLHVGHATTLWKLRALQEDGHKVQLLLGDFTTRIGDPTGRSKTRPVITEREIEKNARAIQKEVSRILLTNPRVLEFRRNSEWFGKMKVADFLRILSLVTHARLIERDMFQERIKRGEEIHVHELLYPVLQGYDSHMLKSDCTIVGSDQLFNESMGRFFQERFNERPQAIVTLRLLPGLDGKEKMSKSAGNFIALGDTPREKFGKIMSLPDPFIIDYMVVYTDLPLPEVEKWKSMLASGENPMNAKRGLARALVRRYHGDEAADAEDKNFTSLFSKKEIPDDIPELTISAAHEIDPIDLVMATAVVTSRSEAKRLIKQRAVELDGEVVSFEKRDPHKKVLKIGKKHFFKIK